MDAISKVIATHMLIMTLRGTCVAVNYVQQQPPSKRQGFARDMSNSWRLGMQGICTPTAA